MIGMTGFVDLMVREGRPGKGSSSRRSTATAAVGRVPSLALSRPSCWRNQHNDQRLVMTVNAGNITPSATYNKGKALIVASVGKSSGNAVETQSNNAGRDQQ